MAFVLACLTQIFGLPSFSSPVEFLSFRNRKNISFFLMWLSKILFQHSSNLQVFFFSFWWWPEVPSSVVDPPTEAQNTNETQESDEEEVQPLKRKKKSSKHSGSKKLKPKKRSKRAQDETVDDSSWSQMNGIQAFHKWNNTVQISKAYASGCGAYFYRWRELRVGQWGRYRFGRFSGWGGGSWKA